MRISPLIWLVVLTWYLSLSRDLSEPACLQAWNSENGNYPIKKIKRKGPLVKCFHGHPIEKISNFFQLLQSFSKSRIRNKSKGGLFFYKEGSELLGLLAHRWNNSLLTGGRKKVERRASREGHNADRGIPPHILPASHAAQGRREAFPTLRKWKCVRNPSWASIQRSQVYLQPKPP